MSSLTSDAGGRPNVDLLTAAIADALGSRRRAAGRLGQSVSAVSGAAILASAMAMAPTAAVFAQDAESEDAALEQITVTGSRIRRQDFTANSPIMTVDESQFEDTTSVGVETVLNRLPQFVPAVTQFTTTDVQQTATNTVGASTVSLRGLGPNRNLVLIDGRRAMPANPTMTVDTNSIPSAAIERTEVISGGASAVYGADAVGGVVNFVLKDDFEGASIDVRFGDTQHGGSQELTMSGLFGANVADGQGNVMMGIERSTRKKQYQWQRDWRIEDMANPRAGSAGGAFFGTETSFTSVPAMPGDGSSIIDPPNNPNQNVVNDMFSEADACDVGAWAFAPPGNPDQFAEYAAGNCPENANEQQTGVPNTADFFINRTPDGTGGVFTGLMNDSEAAGSYRYNGPFNEDPYGNFEGLPFRVRQPNGNIKENVLRSWTSTPLERLSAFGRGVFDVSDNVRMTSQLTFSNTESRTSLGLSSDLVNPWGAEIPYGSEIYEGNAALGIPSSLTDEGATHPDYQPGGRYDLNCDADGQPGCTMSETWPLPEEVQTLLDARRDSEANVLLQRPPDYLMEAGSARGGENATTTFQLSLGVEGELPGGGNHFWDVGLSTGRTDQSTDTRGGTRLSQYRAIMAQPNFGVNSTFDPNPHGEGFAEAVPTCTSGLPVVRDFEISQDCLLMLMPVLQNKTELDQHIIDANIAGDIVEMSAGPLQYALGATRRENSYSFTPDNLVLNQSATDSVAGLFPNEPSVGEFDVSEIYGELLIPVVSDGPTGVESFSFELGWRTSDWSLDQVGSLNSYKALIDWAITPRYRIRGGFNIAHRAPNLGELFVARTQTFSVAGSQFGDHCSQNTANTSPYGANPAAEGNSAEQAAQALAICEALMGATGASEYYDVPPAQQPGIFGGVGIPNNFGNPNLQEEEAETVTLGVVMDFLEQWTMTVDYYNIEITDMIGLKSGDVVYEECLSLDFNPDADPTLPACDFIFRNPNDGSATSVDRTFSNAGRAEVTGVDLQLNYSTMLGDGAFNWNMVANYNLGSETQEREDLPTTDWAGTTGCALQLQCQGYDFRVFNTFGYAQGPWNLSLRHQYWPSIDSSQCLTDPSSAGCLYGGVQTDYQLFALTAGYTFGDNYRLSVGIENLLDEEPPLTGADPTAEPFPEAATHQSGATYDPLGRRGFVSLTMDF